MLRVRIAAPDSPRGVLILLHGFGAAGDDLVSLADWLDIPDAAFVFPEAPLELGGLYGDARAWWMIDPDSIGKDRSGQIPDGLANARMQVLALLDELVQRWPGAPIVLGGFSQGAMLALDVALHTEQPLAGLVLLSGTLIARKEWEPRMASRAGLHVLQSHGRRDPLLPYAAAETLRDLMIPAGLPVTVVPLDGQHEIPPPLLDLIAEFVRVLFYDPSSNDS
jgi:phospholipase/carboxylesterase